MTDPPKRYQKIIIFAPTPSFLERGDLALEKDIEKYRALRIRNNFWQRNTLIIETGKYIKPTELARKLTDLGYEKYPLSAESHIHKGEFSWTGGLITIFPINSPTPITIEFIGNEIAAIEEAKIVSHKSVFEKKTEHKFEPGDFVVHEDHGIGIFRRYSDTNEQFLILEYAPARKGGEPDRLFVPQKVSDKVAPYLGLRNPKINRLGTPLWFHTKKKAKEDIIKFAHELLALYQTRADVKRNSYDASELEKEIWENFQFEETPGQKKALEDIFSDFSKNEPMERLVIGDVGFGKTEVALRAALRVILNGKQAALLAPTTVLADQHAQVFKERFEALGLNVARFTRLEKSAAVRNIKKFVLEGKTDILIGTHRALSKELEFKSLGLLIIDEEQRFGVRQKETLKKKYPEVDILYLSATPIPRTLAFSISKIRPMSFISDPPEGRKPIVTFILPRTDKIIKEAIAREIERKGQIYFLVPRIEKIGFIKNKLDKLFPKVKKAVLHARLPEKDLVKSMHDFREGSVELLISTTIIENGLDISNVNTLIVENSALLGLAQAHQLRGRIGRKEIQAYAYFLYPSKKLTPLAQERLETLVSFQELGAGFEIAKKDLEIRGAGNVLGREQSGVINKIGWNLYFQYLSESLDETSRIDI
ncbi:DEAD/DEAH box helicase [Candidatus Giovannonibacteria bacterium]|nr:DEAD/DEAH box helicase [Candidatus Giovannonibacteria bacterium]